MLSENVRKYRRNKGLSQRQLAEIIGSHQSDIGRIETGETKNPTWQRMIDIANALGVSLDTLAGRNGAQNRKGEG